jgi:8-oxo-dGTP diphosphatase
MAEKYIDVAADALVFSRDGDDVELLLVRRKLEPFTGEWAFPGGFVNYGEDLEAAALRELEEETGVKLPGMKQLHTFGTPGRDPRGHTVSVVFYAFVNAYDHPITAGDDAAEAKWVSVKTIEALAFDHMEILEMAMQRLDLGPYSHRRSID